MCPASVGDVADPLPSAGSMEDTWSEAEKGRDSHDAVRPRVRGVAQVASLGVQGSRGSTDALPPRPQASGQSRARGDPPLQHDRGAGAVGGGAPRRGATDPVPQGGVHAPPRGRRGGGGGGEARGGPSPDDAQQREGRYLEVWGLRMPPARSPHCSLAVIEAPRHDLVIPCDAVGTQPPWDHEVEQSCARTILRPFNPPTLPTRVCTGCVGCLSCCCRLSAKPCCRSHGVQNAGAPSQTHHGEARGSRSVRG